MKKANYLKLKIKTSIFTICMFSIFIGYAKDGNTVKLKDSANLLSYSAGYFEPFVTPNNVPTVQITSPSAGIVINAIATIIINATAADSDGTITKVEFYNGTTKLGEDTSIPYSYTWNDVYEGTYTLTARAIDNNGNSTISTEVPITVSDGSNQNPVVKVTSPTQNAAYISPATIRLIATATDNDGTITKVEFYANNVLITTENNAPYDWTWTNVPASQISVDGTYYILAKAYDNSGGITTSDFVTITVSGSATSEFIVDNLDAGFTTTGTWTASTGLPGFWKTNYLHDGDNVANTTDGAKWKSPIISTGTYDVFMRWTSAPDRPDAAPVEVNYNGGVTNLTVNQRTGGGTWVKIGSWSFTGGSGDYVSIKASDAGYTIADAVRWVPANVEPFNGASSRIESSELAESSLEAFSITPNPTNGFTKIRLIAEQDGSALIEIFDQLGQEPIIFNKVVSKGENDIEINVSNLSSGIHSVKITLGGKILIQKLIKQ